MDININARFLTQPVTGVQRYAVELVKALDDLIDRGEIDSKRFSFVLLAPKNIGYEPKLRHIPLRRVGRFSGYLWEQFELPFYSRRGLLVSLCNTSAIFKRDQIVTIHDAAVAAAPDSYSPAFRMWYRILLWCIGKMARRVITVSNFSKAELVKHFRIDGNRIEVIYHGKEHLSSIEGDAAVLGRHGIAHGRFVLAVSSLSRNKNFRSLVKAFEMLGDTGFDIVIAGGVNPKVFGKSRTPLPGSVKYLGYVTDSELKELYRRASCFVYPSYYEGFGLPPVEAMSCGCPVIVSNTSSLPEICRDAALYCNPHDPEDIADKIKKIMSSEALRDELRRKGLERAGLFTWELCARRTYVLIAQVLNKQKAAVEESAPF